METFFNTIALYIFLLCIILALYILYKNKSLSGIFLVLLMIGGFMYAFGEYLDETIDWKDGDDFVESFTVFLATILLLIGMVIILEEKIKENDKIRADFIRRSSHELKTPLNSITAITDHLLTNYKDEMNEDVLKMVSIINRGGIRLNKLAENMLDVLKLTSGGLRLVRIKINLKEILVNCIDDISYLAKQRNIVIKTELEPGFTVFVDNIRMENVITNILSNAIKNTPPPGIIFVKLIELENFIEVRISDTGVGFTEEEQQNVFKRFGKLERNGEGLDIITEGSGLGLFISREIVELHGGKLWVESEGRNKGSTFLIKLPKN